MAIPTSGAVSTAADVPAGVQTTFKIEGAEFTPSSPYGPQIELDLVITDEKYFGTPLKYWTPLQQPRLSKVRRLRKEGLDDEVIEGTLRKQGFRFNSVDEEDEITLSRLGNTYKILHATRGGNYKATEAILAECNSFDELADALVGGTFVGTTAKSGDGKYVNLDGREEIYPDRSGDVSGLEEEEGFDTPLF